jgi:hypothetical protein
MKNKFFFFCIVFFVQQSFAQAQDAWVFFKDKPSEAVFLSAPLSMLSQRSLDRRIRYNINLDSKDVPIEELYYNQIKNSTGITIKAKSKWLNALHVSGNEAAISSLAELSFVEKIEWADKTILSSKNSNISSKIDYGTKKLEVVTDFNYGTSANQIEMLKGDVLHKNNFTGGGMYIAILDGGFTDVDSNSAFNRLRVNNQIVGTYNFVERNENVYSRSSHGTSVLSTIGGYVEGSLVGTAPDANFFLFITEDVSQEVPLEESLWVEAAEKADSLGVDVMNTSLGYSSFFDNANHNYPYEAMDGKTTFISRGASIAFTRGMFLVNSAGNEGNDPWHYINAPADVANVLSIGAVNAAGTIATFSSFGPTSDGRVKPDVSAQGSGTVLVKSTGTIATGNGTSFSSPVIAGVIACLWQAFPEKSNLELLELIRESGHLYPSFTNQEGYGIPNFQSIYNLLSVDDSDLDGDGVLNAVDFCPNTPIGASVDEKGCLVLASDNFNIEVISETCPDKNNGRITITTSENYNFTTNFNGVNYSFLDSSLVLEDLSVGTYEICIGIEDQLFKQCYTLNIKPGTSISGKANTTSKSVIIEMEQGTKPFSVFVNGFKEMETDFSTFEINVNHEDLVEVKTSVACEGVFSKKIILEDLISAYPNPTTKIVKLNLPNDMVHVQIRLFNSSGQELQVKNVGERDEIDLSHLSKGVYFINVETNTESKRFKVVKN